jgi:hypothetical protein
MQQRAAASTTVEIPSDFRVVIIFLAVAVFLLILVIVIGIFCQQFGNNQQKYIQTNADYGTNEMGAR